MLKRVLKIIGVVVVLLLLALALFLALRSPGKASPVLDQGGNAVPGSISEIVFADIGGIQQGMILRGENPENPVLLFLHGGPGSTEFAFTREAMDALEADYTICWWEQRGAGISYHKDIPPESMTLSQLAQDTAEVSRYLMQRFGQEKVYLMGHSWGTFLGTHAVAEYPELFHAYIAIGQVADQLRSEQLAYEYMIENGSEALRTRLSQFTIAGPEDLTTAYMQVRSTGMNQLGIGIRHEYRSYLSDLAMPVLLCREYTFGQKINYLRGMQFSQEHLWDIVARTDLFGTITSLDVPVYMIQGAYDYQTSTVVAKEYFDQLEAPSKEYFLFEHSAHSPLIEEPERFTEVLRSVLP